MGSARTAMSDKNSFENALRQGTRLLQLRKVEEAIRLLEKAHALDGTHVNAALNLGGGYILAGRHRKAVPVLEGILPAAKDNTAVWINLGAAYLGNPILAKDEQQLKAIDAFERALEIDPAAYSVHYNIGLIYRDRNEREKAIEMFKRALDVNPHDRDALSQLNKLNHKPE